MRIVDSGSVTFKAVLIGVIVLLLLIPLAMLQSVVTERAGLREQAYQRVAEGWGGELTAGGPLLIVPTEREIAGREPRIQRTDVYLLPAKLDADVKVTLDAQPRYVGIYAVPVYLSTLNLQGDFDFTSLRGRVEQPGVTFLWAQARLRLPISNVRSLREIKEANFAGQQVKLGPAVPGIYSGIEAMVDLTQLHQSDHVRFDFATVIAGSRALSMLPLGSVTTVNISADWPHPSFQGAFLPVERKIDDAGFQARWQVLELNRSYGQAWYEDEGTKEAIRQSAFGVSLFQPVDIYQRGERAVKYAVLFIALTFLTFFAWEHMSRNRLHPLQYLLVGLALSMFYLLLIALSEHIAFALAYITAAAALVLLIGLYLAGALGSTRRGVIAAGAMSLVYGLLYMLVLSEDYSLLLGSIILFAALAAVMLATRRVDWYRLRPEEPSRTEASYR